MPLFFGCSLACSLVRRAGQWWKVRWDDKTYHKVRLSEGNSSSWFLLQGSADEQKIKSRAMAMFHARIGPVQAAAVGGGPNVLGPAYARESQKEPARAAVRGRKRCGSVTGRSGDELSRSGEGRGRGGDEVGQGRVSSCFVYAACACMREYVRERVRVGERAHARESVCLCVRAETCWVCVRSPPYPRQENSEILACGVCARAGILPAKKGQQY